VKEFCRYEQPSMNKLEDVDVRLMGGFARNKVRTWVRGLFCSGCGHRRALVKMVSSFVVTYLKNAEFLE
jgi:hypothetical protein